MTIIRNPAHAPVAPDPTLTAPPARPTTNRDTQHKVAFVAPADTLTPAGRYQELFVDVQMSRIFADSKTFVDCVPRRNPDAILADYRAERHVKGFDLGVFVHANFAPEKVESIQYVSDPNKSLSAHIDELWPVLTRHPVKHPPCSSLLQLPNPYVVPGGRFAELYYWDSYFTMLGLAASGRRDLLCAMADNFAYLIDTYGLIPNGTRTYYLSRSQPPVFALMTELFATDGVQAAHNYLPQLRKEYAFWMEGAESLASDAAVGNVVRMPGGEVLNRYWDERDTPREEAYLEDVSTAARQSARPASQVYRDLRAAAASGWDFSSRWLDEGGGLETVRTTAIVPIDLNSFLFKLETAIAELSEARGDSATYRDFAARADARKAAISRYLWDERDGAFFDFDWQRGRRRPNLTAATATPLYVRLATAAQAQKVAATIAARLLQAGGIATTEVRSGQQWDRPNGWAPLQWLAIRGLAHYGFTELSHDITDRWLRVVARLYQRDSKLVEKYVLRLAQDGGAVGGHGGEYPLQDGFGWTNGVTRKLLQQHPQHEAGRSQAGEWRP